jgi:cytoplasmic iron level regulating protein YaaA (DUF328/UPF0246 family)
VYPDPKYWLKIFAKTETFLENHPGNTNISRKRKILRKLSRKRKYSRKLSRKRKFSRNEICETKFREKGANFRLFSFFAKMKKGVFVSTLVYITHHDNLVTGLSIRCYLQCHESKSTLL